MSTKPGRGAHRDNITPAPLQANENSAPDRASTQSPPGGLPTSDRRSEVAASEPDYYSEPSRGDVLSRQKDRFGGIKWGAAFFGWLTAIGTAVLLAAVGGAIGLSITGGLGQTGGQNIDVTQTGGIVSAIVAAAVLLIAYYCGGYVAGRMARFNGVKQGIAVWVWTIVITIVVAILAAIAGSRFDALRNVDGLPQLSVNGGDLALTAIVGAAIALAVALVGAILGGLAGMRFHRKIDRADLDPL